MKEPKHEHSFYLAGRYSRRERYQQIAEDIEARSGWRSGARWLVNGPQDEVLPDDEIAERDLEDIRRCDALILVHSDNRRGGMWVEFGYALSDPGIRTIFWREPSIEGFDHEAPVFAASADYAAPSIDWVVDALRDIAGGA